MTHKGLANFFPSQRFPIKLREIELKGEQISLVRRSLSKASSLRFLLSSGDETLSVAAMCVNNPDRSSVGINCCDAAPTPTGFAEIASDRVKPRRWAGKFLRPGTGRAQAFFWVKLISSDAPFCLAGCDSRDDVGLRLLHRFCRSKVDSAAHRDAVIRVYDEAGNVIETHDHAGDFKEPVATPIYRLGPKTKTPVQKPLSGSLGAKLRNAQGWTPASVGIAPRATFL